MNQNDNRDLNEAILTGVLGLSAVFFYMKDFFEPENKTNFIALIIIYTIAAIWRMFGILLDYEQMTNSSIHYCRLILIPSTIWVTISILFTELGITNIGSISFYSFIAVDCVILIKVYGVEVRNPIVLNTDNKKVKKN